MAVPTKCSGIAGTGNPYIFLKFTMVSKCDKGLGCIGCAVYPSSELPLAYKVMKTVQVVSVSFGLPISPIS